MRALQIEQRRRWGSRGRYSLPTLSHPNCGRKNQCCFAKQLGIQQRRCHISIGDLNTISTSARATLKATVKSRNSNYSRTLTFFKVPNISSVIPKQLINRKLKYQRTSS
ncbi:unnamed protein product [Heterotrigona itama]|uniref:Uncharacterized protein n=1 Tax=Heterotrigona itama TaxID=395501 RepID=A0A6V7H497_9HYME|nr:unnamed protein product [Heterotrigona itama]